MLLGGAIPIANALTHNKTINKANPPAPSINQEPDAIFSTLVGKSIIPFYRDQQRLGTKLKKVPIFSPITKETELEAIGAEYGAGHYSSASYFQSLPTPENLAFIRRFQQFTGEKRAISSVMYNTYLSWTTSRLKSSTEIKFQKC